MKAVIITVLGLLLAACTSGHPIYNPETPIPEHAQAFPLERIEELIIAGARERNWLVTREGPGHLSAAQQKPKYTATVDIYFDQKSYRIAYRTSAGLNATQNGTIHQHYNLWIGNLKADIDEELHLAR